MKRNILKKWILKEVKITCEFIKYISKIRINIGIHFVYNQGSKVIAFKCRGYPQNGKRINLFDG
jgi:hypothetical protein